MPRLSYGKRFWHIWGPFIINWGVGIAVSIFAAALFMGKYMSSHMEEVMAAYQDHDAMMKIAYKVTANMQNYTTQIGGVTALIVIPVMLLLLRRDEKRRRQYGVLPNKKAGAVWYLPAVALTGMLSMAVNNLILIGNLSDYSDSWQSTAEAFYSAPFSMQILCLGILTPISEELVFRGLMYRRLREDTGMAGAIVYSAVVFSIFHSNLVQMLYALILGVLLAWLCEKYGSVLAPIAGHAAANLLSVLATNFGLYDRMMSDIRIIGLVTVACATGAAVLFLRIRQIEEKPAQGESGQGV